MSNVLIYTELLQHEMHLSFKKKQKGEREIDFRLKQSLISCIQADICLTVGWGPALDGLNLFMTSHSYIKLTDQG